MSQSAAPATDSPFDYKTASVPLQGHIDLSTPEDYQREVLRKAHQKVLWALASAQTVVSGMASCLYDVEAAQTDVSARLCSRTSSRIIGKKRKLSPSIYDYDDLLFPGGAGKADTPTQELLPAFRSELRNHQLQAVRWLASLEQHGVGGVLADEQEADRRAAVAGLLSHMLLLPWPHVRTPEEQIPLQSPGPAGGVGSLTTRIGCGLRVCLLLAPAAALSGWAAAISDYVNVCVHVHDGTADSVAALQAACGGLAGQGTLSQAHMQRNVCPLTGLSPTSQQQLASLASSAPPSTGHQPAGPPGFLSHLYPTLSCCNSSAAGVYPPPHHHNLHPAAPVLSPAVSPLVLRPGVGGGTGSLLVVLAPLEHLHRDIGLLSQIPQRVLVVDLARERGADCSADRRDTHNTDSCCGSGDTRSNALLRTFGVDDGISGGASPGVNPCSCLGPCAHPRMVHRGIGSQRGQGMDLNAFPHLHFLIGMPAACRVLMSAGLPEPSGDGIWLLLQLLAPQVHRPLWEAVSELQRELLANSPVGAEYKERLLAEIRERLWGLLCPITLHRRASDVDLSTMRATTTNLNLFDHFSAASNEDG